MRRLAVLAASVSLLFAAACGGSGGGDATKGAESSASSAASASAAPVGPPAAVDDLKVTGDAGKKPQVSFPPGTPPATSSAKTIKEGDGDAIKSGDNVVVNLTAFNWDGKTNAMVGSTYDEGSPQMLKVGDTLPKIIHTAFQNAKVGERFFAVVAIDSLSPEQLQQAKAQGTDKTASLYVVDVLGTSKTKAAKGEAVKLDIKGITLENPGGEAAPKLTTKTDVPAPTDLVAKTVIKGDGPKVKSGQAVIVQYTGKIWGTDKEFDSSWTRGDPVMFQIGTGKVIKGWDQGLVGVPVGSRVVLAIPPKLGYGEQGQGEIKGTDTLVFVVDVLEAY
ncbi:FKBP-type peptidyl-prolyl cis-trans isomerase [Thermopolyspora sp. NPDC052614]|uniref:FKBP-type peptidyl-prolyl cis-trans isomerase n=1 Tax=Thermopolyspora sp. NPDC052614 TaxID=3155682 RepID=UPI003423A1A9